jgi:hypothetical protein
MRFEDKHYDYHRRYIAGLINSYGGSIRTYPCWQGIQDLQNKSLGIVRPYRSEEYAGLSELGIRA